MVSLPNHARFAFDRIGESCDRLTAFASST